MQQQTSERDRDAVLARFAVSRETADRLDRFVATLLKWQGTTNLIAPSTIPDIWTRHVADSLQLLAYAGEDATHWVDLGAGGGFPGLPVGCVLAERPGAHIHLVESAGKKAAFLREAARIAGVPATIHAARIEDVGDRVPRPIHIVTARALAPLNLLLRYAEPFLRDGAMALFLKGQDVESELTEATRYWNIGEIELLPSLTDPAARVLRLRDVKLIQPPIQPLPNKRV